LAQRRRGGSIGLSREGVEIDYDQDKVDEMVLALLWLTRTGDGRAWKGHDWDAMDRLHAKGYISDPKSKAKSVVLSEEGERLSQELFERHFARKRRATRA
jgi:hypothetical protein